MGFCGGDKDENDFEKGAREERAKIMKWLREAANAIDAEIGVRGCEGSDAARNAADAIERDDHDA